MKTIYKFVLPGKGESLVPVPQGGIIRHIDQDPANGWVAIWFEVDDKAPILQRRFEIVGTGQEVPARGSFVGTAITGAYVWHIYETT